MQTYVIESTVKKLQQKKKEKKKRYTKFFVSQLQPVINKNFKK